MYMWVLQNYDIPFFPCLQLHENIYKNFNNI